MRIDNLLSDETVLKELGGRLAQTRLERNISQSRLASEAGVAKTTVERLERGGGIQLESFIRILRALGLLDRLDVVLSEPLPSPIERLKLQGRQRQRARDAQGEAPSREDAEPWRWADDPDDGR
ncbi:MAG: helix-turn-helix transcriptional regulator [Solirubrobacterales bacterium]